MKSINQHWDDVILSVETQVKSITDDKIFSEIEQQVGEQTYHYVFDEIWISAYKEITRFIFGIFRNQY